MKKIIGLCFMLLLMGCAQIQDPKVTLTANQTEYIAGENITVCLNFGNLEFPKEKATIMWLMTQLNSTEAPYLATWDSSQDPPIQDCTVLNNLQWGHMLSSYMENYDGLYEEFNPGMYNVSAIMGIGDNAYWSTNNLYIEIKK